MTSDAIAVVKHFATESNILLGHSYGTAVVARVNRALSASRNIDCIVLISGADSLPSGGHPIFMLPVFVLQCLEPYLSSEFVRLAFSESTAQELKQECIAVNAKNDTHVCRCFYRQMEWATPRDWECIRCPFLILHGEDDKLIPIRKSEALYRTLTFHASQEILSKSSFHRILYAGHQVHQEKAEDLRLLLADFIIQNTRHRGEDHGFTHS